MKHFGLPNTNPNASECFLTLAFGVKTKTEMFFERVRALQGGRERKRGSEKRGRKRHDGIKSVHEEV